MSHESAVSLLVKLLAGVMLVYVAVTALIWLFQERLIYYPQMGREIVATPTQYGLSYDDFTITTADGERLNVWWVPTENPRGAVLLLNGNAGNISHRIEYARMFRTLGYTTLLVDYRGYGKSSGTPSEAGTYRDAEAAWRWLTETRGIPPGDIVLFGESLGGAVASWIAARTSARALVLASTFTSAKDLGADLYWFLPVRLISKFDYGTLERLNDVKVPVLVIHSPTDEIVPFLHGQRLYAAAHEPKAFLEISGGHNEGFVFKRGEWVTALGAFLEQAGQQPQQSFTKQFNGSR